MCVCECGGGGGGGGGGLLAPYHTEKLSSQIGSRFLKSISSGLAVMGQFLFIYVIFSSSSSSSSPLISSSEAEHFQIWVHHV